MKKRLIECAIMFAVSVVATFAVTWLIALSTFNPYIKDYFETTDPEALLEFHNKYSFFLDDEKAEYLIQLSEDFGVDCNLVVAILMVENPSLNPEAVSKMNRNGTVDIGLFQLNDKCLYEKGGYLDLYWMAEFPKYDNTNWKHNTYIAIKHIKNLCKAFGENPEKVAAAYNCGAGRVFEGNLPNQTKRFYVPAVMNNYNMIKGAQK